MATPTVNSLAKGLKILESFTLDSLRLSLSEISRMTETPKASTHRILKTLTDLNYLKYDARSREYYLGPRVLQLGYSVMQSMEIREIVRPYLEELSRECRKTVNFAILDDTEMVYVERIRAPDIHYFNIMVGSRIPIYNTAMGRAVIAFLDEKKLNVILDKLQADEKAIPFVEDRGKLRQRLEGVRENGYSTADDEYMDGLKALAVPIFNANEVIVGINLVFPNPATSVEEIIGKYSALLLKTGKEISDILGYTAAGIR